MTKMLVYPCWLSGAGGSLTACHSLYLLLITVLMLPLQVSSGNLNVEPPSTTTACSASIPHGQVSSTDKSGAWGHIDCHSGYVQSYVENSALLVTKCNRTTGQWDKQCTELDVSSCPIKLFSAEFYAPRWVKRPAARSLCKSYGGSLAPVLTDACYINFYRYLYFNRTHTGKVSWWTRMFQIVGMAPLLFPDSLIFQGDNGMLSSVQYIICEGKEGYCPAVDQLTVGVQVVLADGTAAASYPRHLGSVVTVRCLLGLALATPKLTCVLLSSKAGYWAPRNICSGQAKTTVVTGSPTSSSISYPVTTHASKRPTPTTSSSRPVKTAPTAHSPTMPETTSATAAAYSSNWTSGLLTTTAQSAPNSEGQAGTHTPGSSPTTQPIVPSATLTATPSGKLSSSTTASRPATSQRSNPTQPSPVSSTLRRGNASTQAPSPTTIASTATSRFTDGTATQTFPASSLPPTTPAISPTTRLLPRPPPTTRPGLTTSSAVATPPESQPASTSAPTSMPVETRTVTDRPTDSSPTSTSRAPTGTRTSGSFPSTRPTVPSATLRAAPTGVPPSSSSAGRPAVGQGSNSTPPSSSPAYSTTLHGGIASTQAASTSATTSVAVESRTWTAAPAAAAASTRLRKSPPATPPRTSSSASTYPMATETASFETEGPAASTSQSGLEALGTVYSLSTPDPVAAGFLSQLGGKLIVIGAVVLSMAGLALALLFYRVRRSQRSPGIAKSTSETAFGFSVHSQGKPRDDLWEMSPVMSHHGHGPLAEQHSVLSSTSMISHLNHHAMLSPATSEERYGGSGTASLPGASQASAISYYDPIEVEEDAEQDDDNAYSYSRFQTSFKAGVGAKANACIARLSPRTPPSPLSSSKSLPIGTETQRRYVSKRDLASTRVATATGASAVAKGWPEYTYEHYAPDYDEAEGGVSELVTGGGDVHVCDQPSANQLTSVAVADDNYAEAMSSGPGRSRGSGKIAPARLYRVLEPGSNGCGGGDSEIPSSDGRYNIVGMGGQHVRPSKPGRLRSRTNHALKVDTSLSLAQGDVKCPPSEKQRALRRRSHSNGYMSCGKGRLSFKSGIAAKGRRKVAPKLPAVSNYYQEHVNNGGQSQPTNSLRPGQQLNQGAEEQIYLQPVDCFPDGVQYDQQRAPSNFHRPSVEEGKEDGTEQTDNLYLEPVESASEQTGRESTSTHCEYEYATTRHADSVQGPASAACDRQSDDVFYHSYDERQAKGRTTSPDSDRPLAAGAQASSPSEVLVAKATAAQWLP